MSAHELIGYISLALIWLLFIGLSIYYHIWKKKLNVKKPEQIKQTCQNCIYNDKKYDRCVVGTHYANKGLNRMCYSGELCEIIK